MKNKSIQEFSTYVEEQIFIAGELEGDKAVEHFESICNVIATSAGEHCPYLLVPRRLQIVHLESIGRYEEALELAKSYRELVKRHLYLDDMHIRSVDLIIARLIKCRDS